MTRCSPSRVLLVVVTLGLGWLIPWLLFRNSTKSDGFLHEPVSGVFIALFAVAGAAIIWTFSVRRIDVDLLKSWNLLLFVLHLASGVALAWLASSSGTWTAYVTFSRSQWGKNTPDNTTSGFDADTCQDGNCYVTTVPCLLSQANIEYMVLAFHLLSTLQHLAVWLDWYDHYRVNILDGNHWMRWFEYSFSASIMFASWAFLCGITDVVALVPLCVCVGTTQIFGYFSDAAARMTKGWRLEASDVVIDEVEELIVKDANSNDIQVMMHANVQYANKTNNFVAYITEALFDTIEAISSSADDVDALTLDIVNKHKQNSLSLSNTTLRVNGTQITVESQNFTKDNFTLFIRKALQQAVADEINKMGVIKKRQRTSCRKKFAVLYDTILEAYNAFTDNRPLQVKVVGVVYITYAAVLAWPLAVQDDIALLVNVTIVVLGLHFAFFLLGVGIVCLKKRRKEKVADARLIANVVKQIEEPTVQETLYPVPKPWRFGYYMYDLAQLGALVYLLAQRDTVIQDHHNWARNIAYLALGGVALCMLKVAPYARNTQADKDKPEAKQQSGADRFVSPIWIFTLAWVPYLLGAWFMTFAVFHDSLQHPGTNAGDPPDALYVIIVTQFLFFSCFAGAQIWYLWDPHQQRYLDTEFYFCLLSLVSKTALAWSLYSGASGRKDFGLIAPGVRQAGQNFTGMDLPPC